ncbi:MAG: hypothetical protein HQK96_20450 [Nitrospirae bacterium]|nr:hypothetical protein [Nitrospirota bacterium]
MLIKVLFLTAALMVSGICFNLTYGEEVRLKKQKDIPKLPPKVIYQYYERVICHELLSLSQGTFEYEPIKFKNCTTESIKVSSFLPKECNSKKEGYTDKDGNFHGTDLNCLPNNVGVAIISCGKEDKFFVSISTLECLSLSSDGLAGHSTSKKSKKAAIQ